MKRFSAAAAFCFLSACGTNEYAKEYTPRSLNEWNGVTTKDMKPAEIFQAWFNFYRDFDVEELAQIPGNTREFHSTLASLRDNAGDHVRTVKDGIIVYKIVGSSVEFYLTPDPDGNDVVSKGDDYHVNDLMLESNLHCDFENGVAECDIISLNGRENEAGNVDELLSYFPYLNNQVILALIAADPGSVACNGIFCTFVEDGKVIGRLQGNMKSFLQQHCRQRRSDFAIACN